MSFSKCYGTHLIVEVLIMIIVAYLVRPFYLIRFRNVSVYVVFVLLMNVQYPFFPEDIGFSYVAYLVFVC